VLPAPVHQRQQQQQEQHTLLTPQQSSRHSADIGSPPGEAAMPHAAVDLHPVWPGLLQPRATAPRPSSRLGLMRSALQRKAASCPAAMGPPPSAGPTSSATHSLAGSTQQAPAAAAAAVEAASEPVVAVAAVLDPPVASSACSQQELPCSAEGFTRADISPASTGDQETQQPGPVAMEFSTTTTPAQGAPSSLPQEAPCSGQQDQEAAVAPSSSSEQQAGAQTGRVEALPTPSVIGSSLVVDRSKPVRAMVGVRAAWVSKEHRRQGIATQLLEAAR
jgi:hypothetical protein